jgi:hypothetical protein
MLSTFLIVSAVGVAAVFVWAVFKDGFKAER